MSESVEINNELIINWSKFKAGVKGEHLNISKNAYIEFCKMLNTVDFELVSDYIGNKEKVELVYRFNNSVVLNMSSDKFKRQTYKRIIEFKEQLKNNNDEFIKFAELSDGGNLVAEIRTFDGGEVTIDIGAYSKWNKSRQDFYDKLKEVNGCTEEFYKGADIKMNIFIDGVKLNPISPVVFKRTYNAINKFKNSLVKNNDKFVKFVGLSGDGKLVSRVITYDGGEISVDIVNYNSFIKGRQNTYNYCKEKGYKILSPYLGNVYKVQLDFNCGHKPNWIVPRNIKQNQGCPICSKSKGEKTIRLYLEKNKIDFIQEYRFGDCKHKLQLPFDFYIPNKNLCIEFDGIQHFEINHYFGGNKEFKETQIRDSIKNKYCKDNGINLIRIPYWELDNIEDILNAEIDNLKKINKIA